MARRFPPPWRADKIPGGYVVRDADRQALVWIYSRDSEAEAMQAKALTKDEARRIAVTMADQVLYSGVACITDLMVTSVRGGDRIYRVIARGSEVQGVSQSCAAN